MKTVKFIWIVIFAICLSADLFAASPAASAEPSLDQSTGWVSSIKMIKGVVKSGDETLPGAVIEINGKKHFTDLEGCFNIPLSSDRRDCKLKISLISYQSQEISLSPSSCQDLQIRLLQ